MKLLSTVFALCVLSPSLVFADCSNLPVQPALLQETQITLTQADVLKDQLEVYLTGIVNYKTCIDSEVAQLVPPEEDGTDEFFESAEYQAYQQQFDSLMLLLDIAGQNQETTIENYNSHVRAVIDE